MTLNVDDEGELIEAIWDNEFHGKPKWVGRKFADIRADFWRQTMGEDLQEDLDHLAVEGFLVPDNVSDISLLHDHHPTDQELRERYPKVAGELNIFLHLISARIGGVERIVLSGFHADVPGGEWEVFGFFDAERELNADIFNHWYVEDFID